MASINGISVKAMRNFKGHEGEDLFQGNLYLNNKKIGFWSQNAHGGPDHFSLDNRYNEVLLNNAVKALNAEKAEKAGLPGDQFVLEYDLELLMGDYISLCEEEKMYKSALKKGYSGVVIASDGYHQVSWALPQSYMRKTDEDLLLALNKDISNAKQSFIKENEYTKHTVKIYRSAGDFVIGEPISLEAIQRKPKLQDAIDSCEKTSKNKASVSPKELNDRDFR